MRWCVFVILSFFAVLAQAAPSADAQALVAHVLASGDAAGRPFVVVDKRAARLHLYTADGREAGSTAVLVGLAPGDDALPGTGALAHIPAAARTTPAGRFSSEPGHNLAGEAIVWFDYEAGLALHRLRPAPAAERRPQRLASAEAADHRITLGCVVMEGAFFDAVLRPVLGRTRGVVYVMPEARDWRTLFGPADQAASLNITTPRRGVLRSSART